MIERIAGLGCLVLSSLAFAASAQQPPPDYGHNFITIGDIGNPVYNANDPFDRLVGRGAVNHAYRIARTEVTTEQFVPFINALNALSVQGKFVIEPSLFRSWGAVPTGEPGQNEVFPGFEKAPIFGMNWHLAAVYCNWLHNDKRTDFDSLAFGAYDTTTFRDGDARTDQATRSPGARYWIPSFDEWLKAAHYDPNKNGPGQGGWWEFSDGSDTPLVPGAPGVGETSAGWDIDDDDARFIRLESYPDTQSPYGLLDLSGGASEWTEDFQGLIGGSEKRVWQGNPAGTQVWDPVNDPFEFFANLDAGWNVGSDQPGSGFLRFPSVRIASAVPSPATAAVAVPAFAFLIRRRRSC